MLDDDKPNTKWIMEEKMYAYVFVHVFVVLTLKIMTSAGMNNSLPDLVTYTLFNFSLSPSNIRL